MNGDSVFSKLLGRYDDRLEAEHCRGAAYDDTLSLARTLYYSLVGVQKLYDRTVILNKAKADDTASVGPFVLLAFHL